MKVNGDYSCCIWRSVKSCSSHKDDLEYRKFFRQILWWIYCFCPFWSLTAPVSIHFHCKKERVWWTSYKTFHFFPQKESHMGLQWPCKVWVNDDKKNFIIYSWLFRWTVPLRMKHPDRRHGTEYETWHNWRQQKHISLTLVCRKQNDEGENALQFKSRDLLSSNI